MLQVEVFNIQSWFSKKPLPHRAKIVKNDICLVTITPKPYLEQPFPVVEQSVAHLITAKAAQGDSSDLDYTVQVKQRLKDDKLWVRNGLGYRIIFKFQEVEGIQHERTTTIQAEILDQEDGRIVDSINLNQTQTAEVLEKEAEILHILHSYPDCSELWIEMKANLVTISVDDKEILSVPRYGTLQLPDQATKAEYRRLLGVNFCWLDDPANGLAPMDAFRKAMQWVDSNCGLIFSAETSRLCQLQSHFLEHFTKMLYIFQRLIVQGLEKRLPLAKILENWMNLSRWKAQQITELPFREVPKLVSAILAAPINKPQDMIWLCRSLRSQPSDDGSSVQQKDDLCIATWLFLDQFALGVLSHSGVEIARCGRRKIFDLPKIQAWPRLLDEKSILEPLVEEIRQTFRKKTHSIEPTSLIRVNSRFVIVRGHIKGHNMLVDLENRQPIHGGYRFMSRLPGSSYHNQESSDLENGRIRKCLPYFVDSNCSGNLIVQVVKSWGVVLIFRTDRTDLRVFWLEVNNGTPSHDWKQINISTHAAGSGGRFHETEHLWAPSQKTLVGVYLGLNRTPEGIFGVEFLKRGLSITQSYFKEEFPNMGKLDHRYCHLWICKRNRMFSILCEWSSSHIYVHCLFKNRFHNTVRQVPSSFHGQTVRPKFLLLKTRGGDSEILVQLDFPGKNHYQQQFFRLFLIC